jgi:hypothetical protein
VFTVQALTRVNLAWDADRQRGQSAITSAPEQPAQESKYRPADQATRQPDRRAQSSDAPVRRPVWRALIPGMPPPQTALPARSTAFLRQDGRPASRARVMADRLPGPRGGLVRAFDPSRDGDVLAAVPVDGTVAVATVSQGRWGLPTLCDRVCLTSWAWHARAIKGHLQ